MKRGIYAFVAISILGAGAWLLRHKADKKADQEISAPTLPPEDQARINIDPKRHTVTIIDRGDGDVRNNVDPKRSLQGRVRTTFIGNHPARIDIGKDGKVSVTYRKFGTEVSPFVGVAFGTDIKLRAAIGENLFYVQRWDLGGGLLLNSNIKDTRLFAQVEYGAYDNLAVGLGVDNRKTVHCIVSLKF